MHHLFLTLYGRLSHLGKRLIFEGRSFRRSSPWIWTQLTSPFWWRWCGRWCYNPFAYYTTELHLKPQTKNGCEDSLTRQMYWQEDTLLQKKRSSSCLNDTLLHNADTQLQIKCKYSMLQKWNQMSSVLFLSVIGFHSEYGPQCPGSCSSRSARACPASERNMFFPLWIKDVRADRTSSMLPWPGAKLCLVGCSGLVPSVSSGFMVSGFCTDTDLVVCDERWTRHIHQTHIQMQGEIHMFYRRVSGVSSLTDFL